MAYSEKEATLSIEINRVVAIRIEQHRCKPVTTRILLLFFLSINSRSVMRLKPTSMKYSITLEFANAIRRTVDVKASSREVAERRALKRNPNAIRVVKA